MHLLREIERHISRRNITATRFGREAMGDPRFVEDLRNGREPRPRTVARVVAYLNGGERA